MKRVRVGIIGCGAIAQVMHLPYLRELDGLFEISALCDISPGVLRAVSEYYRVARVWASRKIITLTPVTRHREAGHHMSEEG